MTGMNCPVCGGPHISNRFVMCRTCWRRVPFDLQQKVYAAWGARQMNPRDADVVAAHEAAKDDAIKASGLTEP
jgi:hypothetical protein